MTERLYYTDPYLTQFDAAVLDVRDAGGRTTVVLDRTAFYPSSGGQPFDTGSLADARVVDVVDGEDGTILHVVEGQAPAGRVAGRVDWPRRFEHMQQHTGQHVLSAAFERIAGVRTLSFHLGSETSTIDLAREVTPSEIAAAEAAGNDVIWEDRSVTIRFVDAAEAATLPLRKESARTGELRIVEIDGLDVSACGGTHVARTGAIGIVVVSSWERFKGGTRLEFRCGVRALRAHRFLRDTLADAVRLVSVSTGDLPGGIERIQAENKALKRRATDLEARLVGFDADRLAATATDLGGIRAVVEAIPGVEMEGLKAIARGIAARPRHAAILWTATTPSSIVIARAADVALDASALLKTLIARFGGKGGGRPELAQGTVTANRAQIVEAVNEAGSGKREAGS